uniref:Uncharacterized protein n=1 Tax=Anguilla anguilla TaxID=7936 RepID=A0A0E9VZ85_ANGAN
MEVGEEASPPTKTAEVQTFQR